MHAQFGPVKYEEMRRKQDPAWSEAQYNDETEVPYFREFDRLPRQADQIVIDLLNKHKIEQRWLKEQPFRVKPSVATWYTLNSDYVQSQELVEAEERDLYSFGNVLAFLFTGSYPDGAFLDRVDSLDDNRERARKWYALLDTMLAPHASCGQPTDRLSHSRGA